MSQLPPLLKPKPGSSRSQRVRPLPVSVSVPTVPGTAEESLILTAALTVTAFTLWPLRSSVNALPMLNAPGETAFVSSRTVSPGWAAENAASAAS